MKPVFIGSGVAIITPFDKDGKINFKRFEKLLEFQIKNKTDAVIVCGTTGEGSTLTVAERLKLFTLAVDTVNGRVPVIGATGSNSTSFSQALIKESEKTGIDAHLSVTPYYNKASQEGLIRHYYSLADTAQRPLIVYNVPSRTGMNIIPETYYKLSKHSNIKAVKEADSNITKMTEAIKLCGDNLDFYTGNDDLICPSMSVGCKGVISVLANIAPEFTHKMTISGYNGSFDICREMQLRSLSLIYALFSDINPIAVKTAMKHMDMDSGILRLPLCDMNQKATSELIFHLKEFLKTEKTAN